MITASMWFCHVAHKRLVPGGRLGIWSDYMQWNTDFSNLLGKLNLVRKIGLKNLTEAIQGKQFLVRRIGSFEKSRVRIIEIPRYRKIFNWVSKVIARWLWLCFTTLCDWLTKLATLSQPIKCKTKTNRASLSRVFPRLAPVTCICFEFWLVHCPVCVCWFRFYGTQLKTALKK